MFKCIETVENTDMRSRGSYTTLDSNYYQHMFKSNLSLDKRQYYIIMRYLSLLKRCVFLITVQSQLSQDITIDKTDRIIQLVGANLLPELQPSLDLEIMHMKN